VLLSGAVIVAVKCFVQIRKAGKRLRIISATLANRGTYQCSARNPFGEDIGYIRVTVKVRGRYTKIYFCSRSVLTDARTFSV